MVIPKEVGAQRFSTSLGSPRRDLVFDHFLFFFSRAAQQEEEQQLVYLYIICIKPLCSVRDFFSFVK